MMSTKSPHRAQPTAAEPGGANTHDAADADADDEGLRGARAIAKRNDTPPPRVEVLTKAKGPNFPAGRMLISSPLEIAAVVERIPKGRVLAMSDLRTSLAKSHKADYTCPLTTGIFLRIVAEAAEAERPLGKPVTPYWRVVRDDGSLLEKLPGGPTAQADRLTREGVNLLRFRSKPVVADMEGTAWPAPPFGKSMHAKQAAK